MDKIVIKQGRQGDVFLLRIPNPPEMTEAKPIKPINGRYVLAEGEATGHNHTVTTTGNGLFDFTGKTVLVVSAPTTLTHQEHAPIEIAPGTYWVVRQREYSPQAIRRVID